MHSARVLILKSAHAKYLSLWQGGVTVADDGDQIDPALYNRVMLGELMLECLPSLALNITNMTISITVNELMLKLTLLIGISSKLKSSTDCMVVISEYFRTYWTHLMKAQHLLLLAI